MGVCADLCASEYKFTREDQDNYAIQSYERSAKAWADGKFDNEVVPVAVPQRKEINYSIQRRRIHKC
jgi:acetyl-CoA C-acetyltransferase